MKKLVIATVAAMILGACTRQAADTRPTLAVSLEPQRAMLEEIAGPKYRVVTVLGRGADPETFDPPARNIADAAAAERYFLLGVFPFENNIAAGTAEGKTIDLGRGIDLIYGTHQHEEDGHGHEHEHARNSTDPHIWSSLPNARIIARRMMEELITIDPDSAESYMMRYRRLDNRLRTLDSTFHATIPAGTAFAVWHPSLSYFARDYDLHQVSIGFEGKDISARQLREAIENARTAGASVFVVEAGRDAGRIASVNSSIGADTVNVNLMSYDWEQQLRHVAEALAGAQ